jgi:Restriction endonuclease
MVDRLFDRLSSKPDGGLGEFRSMLTRLLQWSHFDPYYFDKLRKLDRPKAQSCLEHLKQLQEIRDAKLKHDRDRRAAQEAERQKPEYSLPELLKEFLELYQDSTHRQSRGYALERILQGLAKLSKLEVTEPFRTHGEQIDGAVKFDGEHYLLEAKWQDKAASNEPLYQFAGKVEGKMYGRGIFVSVHGYSAEVVQSLVIGKAIRTILVDGEDLVLVLEGVLTFGQMLDRKVKAAQTKGLIYIHPVTERPKQ